MQQTGKLINILGQRTGHNLFLVDGVSVTDEYYNNVVLNPSPDAIREFNISKTNYDAEFGGKSGGVINVITQSGTNIFHGALYEYLRNSVFDARNFFAAPHQATPFKENQFGAAFGGPVVKDKTFFFLNYDGQRIRNSVRNFSACPPRRSAKACLPHSSLTRPADTPFPNNAINVPLDPAAVAMLEKVPLPNLPGTANNLLALEAAESTTTINSRRGSTISSPRRIRRMRAVSSLSANEFDPFGSSVLNEALCRVSAGT